MSVTVTVNDREVVTRASGGFSLASPNVCLLPDGTPVPFVSLALASALERAAASVLADGFPVATAASELTPTTGDEPGQGGGVLSGTVSGKASFLTFSPDVTVEGEPVPRAFDMVQHNHGSPPNAISPTFMQASSSAVVEKLLCEALCVCLYQGGRTECVHRFTSYPTRDHRMPFVPGLYPEVSYSPATGEAILSDKPVWWDHQGEPKVPLANYYSKLVVWLMGTKRPDYVLVRNVMRPPHAANLDTIFELKFPGDGLSIEQAYSYMDLCRKLVIINAERCHCERGRPLPLRRHWVDKAVDDLMRFPLMRPSTETQLVMIAVGLVSMAGGAVGKQPHLIMGGATATAAGLWGLLGNEGPKEQ